jgi:membrane protein YqaA with SNARE-associated domain
VGIPSILTLCETIFWFGYVDASTRGIGEYGYSILFLVVFLEAIGVPVPAAVALVVTGAASARGSMNGGFAAAIAVSAIMLGDVLMFLLGRYTGWWLLGVPFTTGANTAGNRQVHCRHYAAVVAVVYDVRSHRYYDPKAMRIQGSRRLDPHAVNRFQMVARKTAKFICIAHACTKRPARRWRTRCGGGVTCSVIRGGLRAWRRAGLALEAVPAGSVRHLRSMRVDGGSCAHTVRCIIRTAYCDSARFSLIEPFPVVMWIGGPPEPRLKSNCLGLPLAFWGSGKSD